MAKCDYCKRKELLARAKKDGDAYTVTTRDEAGIRTVEVHVHPKGTRQHELKLGQGAGDEPFLKAVLEDQDHCTCK